MTNLVDQKSIETFCKYDFVKDSSKGILLYVAETDEGEPILREVNVNTLTLSGMVEFYLSDGRTLEKVVDYVNNYLVAVAQKSQPDKLENWKGQFALLEEKVKRYNQRHSFSKIEFVNPLIDTLYIQVTIPVIPTSLYSGIMCRGITLKVDYSPLTTFQKVEEVIKEKIGPEGYLVEGKVSDRSTIRNLAQDGTKIGEWYRTQSNQSLKIVYSDIDIKKYIEYCYEKGYVKGHFNGRASALLEAKPRMSGRYMRVPELQFEKVITPDELHRKYS